MVFTLVIEAMVVLAPGRGAGIPRTAPVIAGILLFGVAGGARLAVRRFLRLQVQVRHRVAIFGASDVGAGGSIGSELCRQVLALGPKSLVLVDNGEFNLF